MLRQYGILKLVMATKKEDTCLEALKQEIGELRSMVSNGNIEEIHQLVKQNKSLKKRLSNLENLVQNIAGVDLSELEERLDEHATFHQNHINLLTQHSDNHQTHTVSIQDNADAIAALQLSITNVQNDFANLEGVSLDAIHQMLASHATLHDDHTGTLASHSQFHARNILLNYQIIQYSMHNILPL